MERFEEYVFQPPEVLCENVASIGERQSLLEERRICELSEMADAAVRYLSAFSEGGMPVADALSLLSLEAAEEPPIHRDVLRETLPYLLFYQKHIAAIDKTAFISLLAERLASIGLCPSEIDFLPPAAAKETFTYVKNMYADDAYDVFSQSFSDPRLFYSESLKDAIAAVEEGRAGYCLLPLEEKGGVRLASFRLSD